MQLLLLFLVGVYFVTIVLCEVDRHEDDDITIYNVTLKQAPSANYFLGELQKRNKGLKKSRSNRLTTLQKHRYPFFPYLSLAY